jgi:hypothetical protein
VPGDNYQKDDQVRAYYDHVIQELQSLPGVESVACVTSLPSGWSWNWTEYTAEGRPPSSASERPSAISQIVTPDFFRTLRIPLVQGRFVAASDKQGSLPVVVISESMARINWPGQNPLGKHITLGHAGGGFPERMVVGVVRDIRISGFVNAPDPTAYVPFAQQPQSSSAIVVRTSSDLHCWPQRDGVRGDDSMSLLRYQPKAVISTASAAESSAHAVMVFRFTALVLAAAGTQSCPTRPRNVPESGAHGAGARRFDVLTLVVEQSRWRRPAWLSAFRLHS